MLYDNSDSNRFRPRYNFEDTVHLLPQDTPIPFHVRCHSCLSYFCASRRRLAILIGMLIVFYLIVTNMDELFTQMERQSTRVAHRQSFGYFQEPNFQWIERAKHFQEVSHDYHPPPKNDQSIPLWYETHVMVDFDCPTLERVVGSASDPSKWWFCHLQHLHRLDHPCVIYTSGPPNGLLLEQKLQILLPSCDIHVLDPSGLSLTTLTNHSSIHVHPVGLAITNKQGTSSTTTPDTEDGHVMQFQSLPSIMTELGHDHIDLLVLNCAGCEWVIFPHLIQVDLHQLIIQVHGMQQDSFFTKLTQAGFVLFHKAPTMWMQSMGRAQVLSFLKFKKEFFHLGKL
jgi:Methyltransferase domain